MRQPFAVTFRFFVNTSPVGRPAKMEQRTDTRTFWAKDSIWARRIAALKLGIPQNHITSITPKWS